MTNEERRRALALARRNALRHALKAEELFAGSSEDGPEVGMSQMWSLVAETMKDGDPVHDGPDGVHDWEEVDAQHLVNQGLSRRGL